VSCSSTSRPRRSTPTPEAEAGGSRGGAQWIPRPAEARPGGPPPWSSLHPRDRHVDLDRLVRALRATGPARLLPGEHELRRRSAVLVPLFEEDGEAWMVLTRRSQHLRTHRGEVAFPGGRQDEGEALTDTALREAQEEINLDPATVEIVGELDHLATVSSQSVIIPFVGILPGRPLDLEPNPEEVDLILTLPVRDLLDEETFREELWHFGGMDRPMQFFDLVGDTIWGATARILHELLLLVLAEPRR
jgi:8-oxo-dGTP pyrophosphatase MutT (NUDIX family)